MTKQEYGAAAEALTRWFESQQLLPQDAMITMAITSAAMLNTSFKTNEARGSMLISFTRMIDAFMEGGK